MRNARKKLDLPDGSYTCAGVLGLALAVLMHFCFVSLTPEQVDALPGFLQGGYRAVGIAGFSFPLGALGIGLILCDVFKPRIPTPERPRVVVVRRRRPEPAPVDAEAAEVSEQPEVTPQSDTVAQPDVPAESEATAEPVEELEVGEPMEEEPPPPAAPPKIPGRWGAVRLNARRGTTTDAIDPEHTTVVDSGRGQVELASERYMKKRGGRHDESLE